ncbi:hypothetical protein BTR14_01600 [Rhizobium rhizosphaerae]|uniref:Uncharacterized protein n=1 Tax=Xaviernesmea rhizosphaerae TaxID=1672749 RepID=A0ABX3PJ57_9HYPH|nr:DUF6634 family protein [Xaviernesmea rhizosphaerae]OQP88178.1 hypothetical protein BTR14_01600 [Xaviernesmea rhizosphaerae]
MSSDIWFGFERDDLLRKLQNLHGDLGSVEVVDKSKVEAARITDWAVAQRLVPCLIGRTQDHPQMGGGVVMYSSELFYLNEDTGFARTFSRWYRLGSRVAPDYWNSRYSRQR